MKIRQSVEETLRRIPAEQRNLYLKNITIDESGSGAIHNFARWVLFHYLFLSGYIEGSIFFNNSPVFTFGANLLNDKNRNYSGDSGMEKINILHKEKNQSIEITGLVPSDVFGISRKITEMDILPFCRNYYFFSPGYRDERKLDLYEPLEDHITSVIHKSLKLNENICISHFKFQKMNIYFSTLGEHRTREATHDITTSLNKYFKTTDTIVQLSPHSYIVISPGITGQQLKKRFQGIYFQTRSIIFDYELITYNITQTPVLYERIWEELKI